MDYETTKEITLPYLSLFQFVELKYTLTKRKTKHIIAFVIYTIDV